MKDLHLQSIREIAEKYATNIWDHKNLCILDELVHDKVILHSLLGDFHGRQALKDVVKAWLKAFPDLKVTNNHYISENDTVCIQWHATGKHDGEFKGISPTGKLVVYSGVTIYRIQDGQIIEYWAYIDMQHLIKQIH